MRVLVATRGLAEAAGSETYAETLVSELLVLGHQVACFSPRLGEFARRLRSTLGVLVTDDARTVPEPDVIHASHDDGAALAMAAWPLVPAVNVVHGVGTRGVVERPPLWRGSIERWVAVSELVGDTMALRDGVERRDIRVIPNFVDLRRFAPITPVRSPPRNVLVLTNHLDSPLVDLTEQACRQAGLQLRHAGGQRRRYDMVSEINLADIVVTIGRGAIEAMACGRAVVLLSQFGGDGVVTPDTAKQALATNYSGLATRVIPTSDELGRDLLRCTAELGEWSRTWAVENHDASRLVPQLVDVYEEAIARGSERRARLGDTNVLAERLGSVYPALRWWYRVPQEFDAIRAAYRFPVWAPDADEELEVLLAGLRAELEAAQQRCDQLEKAPQRRDLEMERLRHERDRAMEQLEVAHRELETIREMASGRSHESAAPTPIGRLLHKLIRRT